MRNMKYHCVIFDLDGTLLDTSSGVFHATDYVAELYGLPLIPENVKRSFIGPPIQDSFRNYLGCEMELAWELASVWREAYKESFLFDAVPYEGIYDLLKTLRDFGIKTAVATNKREDYTAKLLNHFNFASLFDCIVGSDFEGKRTKSEMIKMCMDSVEVCNTAKCLMIGDTAGDMNAAEKAGVDFLGVTYGFGFKRGDSMDGGYLADSCRDIQKWLLTALMN